MSELEEGGHDGGDGGDNDNDREGKKAKVKFSIESSNWIPKLCCES